MKTNSESLALQLKLENTNKLSALSTLRQTKNTEKQIKRLEL